MMHFPSEGDVSGGLLGGLFAAEAEPAEADAIAELDEAGNEDGPLDDPLISLGKIGRLDRYY